MNFDASAVLITVNLSRLSCLFQGSLISINSTCTEMGNFDNARVTGEIELAVRYSAESRALEIRVGACRNLAFGDERRKRCNPYVPRRGRLRGGAGAPKLGGEPESNQDDCNKKSEERAMSELG